MMGVPLNPKPEAKGPTRGLRGSYGRGRSEDEDVHSEGAHDAGDDGTFPGFVYVVKEAPLGLSPTAASI